MTIKTSIHREKKQATPGPDSSNCNSIYGVFEIGLVGFIWLQPIPILSTHASDFTAGVCEFSELDPHSQLPQLSVQMCLSLSYDTVKHAKYIAVNHR